MQPDMIRIWKAYQQEKGLVRHNLFKRVGVATGSVTKPAERLKNNMEKTWKNNIRITYTSLQAILHVRKPA